MFREVLKIFYKVLVFKTILSLISLTIPIDAFSDNHKIHLKLEKAEQLIHTNVENASVYLADLEKDSEINQNFSFRMELNLLQIKLAWAQGSFKKSQILGEKLLLACNHSRNKAFKLKVLLELALSYQYTGIKPRQFELNQRAFRLANELRDTSAIISVINAVGDIYKNSDQHHLSYNYYKRAHDIAEFAGTALDKAHCYKFMGTFYLTMYQIDSSIYFLNKAMNYFEDSYLKDEACLIWIRLGRSYHYLNRLDSAEYCQLKAKNLAQKIQSPLWMGRSYFQLARIANSRGNFKDAVSYYDSSKVNLLKAEDIIVLNAMYRQYAQLYEKHNALDSAFFLYKTHIEYRDSVKDRMNHEMIISMKWNDKLEKKEKRILYLKERSEILNSRNKAQKRSRLWLFIALGTMTLLTIVIYQLFKQRNKSLGHEKTLRQKDNERAKLVLEHQKKIQEMKEQALQMELEIKNKELTTLIMEISQKSQDIKGIHEKIKLLEDTIKPDSKLETNMLQELRGISRQLKTEAGKEKEWQQFKLHFEQVHTGFFEHLKRAHPDLTAYDLKLCAYFHMNLGIKQVSNILNISYDAVKKQRTRMRKKMGLDVDTNLLNYLNEISGMSSTEK